MPGQRAAGAFGSGATPAPGTLAPRLKTTTPLPGRRFDGVWKSAFSFGHLHQPDADKSVSRPIAGSCQGCLSAVSAQLRIWLGRTVLWRANVFGQTSTSASMTKLSQPTE